MPNASGSWNLSQQLQAKGQDLWPKPPGAPTIGTATLVTATSATVAFTAPTCKGIPATITGYQAISTPGCITATGGSSPITVSGLTSGTAYTFQVRAQNSTGYGSYSASSNSVQAKVPGAPTIGTATAGLSLCASVTFTAPACTGVPAGGITGYMVTSTPGCITKTGASSPLVVTGLTCGTAYTFKVKAQNAVGYGACSAASNSVTAKQPSCVFYSIVGSYSWVAPAGVTSVSVVAVGGGGGGDNNVSGGYGGGGGGLGYRNCIAVTPGSSYTVVVGGGGPANTNGGDSSFNGTAVGATGGKNRTASGGTSGGAYSGSSTGGGSGGSGGNASSYYGAGGGGAGGYAGNGGGGGSGCGSGGNGTAGSGGGGGGGGGGSYYASGSCVWNTGGGGGGGVNIYGQGSSGAAGVANSTGYANPTGGGGGSGGATGAKNCGSPYVGMGGNYGGGGPGGGWYCNGAGTNIRGGGGSGGTGAVRIVWKSPTRGTPSFPSTNVGPS